MKTSEFIKGKDYLYESIENCTALFYQSAKRSEFETIRKTDSQILFNQ